MTFYRRIDLPRRIIWNSNRQKVGQPSSFLRVSNANYCFSSTTDEFQKRCFVSLPNSKDPRPSILRTNPTTTVTTVSNQALLFAAEEADRLLAQSAKHQQYYQSKLLSLDDSNPLQIGQDEMVQQEVMEAANTLLIVSNDLQAMIASTSVLQNHLHHHHHHTQKHIAVLHRAFLALTTKCLDCIRIIQSSSSSSSTTTDSSASRDEHVQALLDPALALARRARDLGLPFHLPLYQRLMEATATTATSHRLPDLILEIASFTDTLNAAAPVHASLFRPALVALIRAKKFVDTVELMHGIRDRHGLAVMDRQTATEMYVNLHTVVKESFCLRLESRRALPETPVTEIVALLEPSILVFSEELEKEAKEQEETLNHMFDTLDDHAMEDMIDSMYDEEEGHEENEEGFDSDDDDDYGDEDGNQMTTKVDPLDQAVNAIITKHVKDKKAKAVFADLVNAAGKPTIVPRIISVTVNMEGSDEVEEEDLDYWADCSSSSSSESDEDEAESQKWMESRRSRFPDVTSQVVQLNDGRDLVFTRKYEEIMWMKEAMEEDSERIEKNYYSGTRLDDEEEEEDDDDWDDDDHDDS